MALIRLKKILVAVIALSLTGCTYTHVYRFAEVEPSVFDAEVPIDTFFAANGFVEIDLDSPPYSDLLAEYVKREGVTRIWEKWYKGSLSEFSGGIRATEEIKDGLPVIVINNWSRESETEEIASSLTNWFRISYPRLSVQYTKNSELNLK